MNSRGRGGNAQSVPRLCPTEARLSSGGRKVAHPGLVVSEGSAVLPSLCAAGLTGEHRLCCFDGCLCSPRVAGGQAADMLHISKARSEQEMKIDEEKWQHNALLIQYIFYHLPICDTSVCVYIYIYICMGGIQSATHRSACVCVVSSVIRAMRYNCIWSPNKQGISPSPWWRWQMWWTSTLAARTTLDLLKIIDLLFASQVGDK